MKSLIADGEISSILKMCLSCSIEKPLSEFRKSKRHRGGYKHVCKDCTNLEENNRPKDLNITKQECRTCDEIKPLSEFHLSSRSKSGHRSECILCSKKRKNQKNYGLSHDDLLNLYEKQKESCAICKTPITLFGLLTNIDHNHETGLVRGLLCRNCNVGLGVFKDSTEILNNAIKYLMGD